MVEVFAGGAFLCMMLATMLFTVLFTVVPALFILRRLWASQAQEAELLRSGVPAPAKVLNLTETGMMVNNRPQVQITVEVQPMDGQAWNATLTKVIGITQVPLVQPGSVVQVRFDPADRSRVALEL